MLVALIGLLVGLAIGATGVGGGVLTVPLLVTVAGRPAAESVGTALAFSTIVKIYGVLHYFLRGDVNRKVLAWLAAGGVPGVIAGSFLLKQLSSGQSMHTALLLVGATVAVTASLSLVRNWRTTQGGSWRLRTLSLCSLAIGLEVGFSSAGAGALGSVALFHCTALTPTAVVGTDLAFGLVLSSAGSLIHTALMGWQPSILAPLLIGGLPGVFCGASLAKAIPAARLRQVVLLWAAVMGIILIRKAL